MSSDLTHFDAEGNARMVDVGDKTVTRRVAKARCIVRMKPDTAEKIRAGSIGKGDVLGVARIAGIMGTKQTAQLIPMCHPISFDSSMIEFEWLPGTGHVDLQITCLVSIKGKTGVEMEALTGASITALTVYDMCKSIDRAMEIRSVCLMEKSGGKSGTFSRDEFATKE